MISRLSLSRRSLAGLALTLAGLRAARASEPWLVCQVVELSGPFAAAGDAWRNGVELAVQEINADGGLLGRLVQVMTFDAQSNPAAARAALLRGLESDPLAVVGPAMSAPARSMLAVPRGIRPLLLGGGAADLIGPAHPNVFRTLPSDAVLMTRLAGWLRDGGGARRLAILSHASEPFRDRGEALARAARGAGLEITGETVTGTDLAADVARALRGAPDTAALLLPAGPAGHAAALARRSAPTVSVIGGASLLAPKSLAAAGEAAEGLRAQVLLADDPDAAELLAFRTRFQRRNADPADAAALGGYVALTGLRAAIAQAGSTEPRAVSEALRRVHVLDGGGWDDNGESTRPSWIVEWRDGAPAVLKKL